MKKAPPSPVKRIVNLISVHQVEYILDGVLKSAFAVTIEEEDGDTVATLSVAEKPVFEVNFSNQTISRIQDGKRLQVFRCPPPKFFGTAVEYKHFCSLEDAIRTQYAIGGQEALTGNLITRREVVVLIDAIRAMAFRCERRVGTDVRALLFDGRECFRIDMESRTILLAGLSGNFELVYLFTEDPEEWFWAGTDRKLWKEMVDALRFYDATMHKVRMADYRAMFGNQMQKVIVGLAAAMDEAEADVRMLEKVDKTNSGSNLHPEVARLVQKDLDAGEQAAQEKENDQ